MIINDKKFTVDMFVEFLPVNDVIGCRLYEEDNDEFYKHCKRNQYANLDDAISAFLKLYSVHPYALLCIEFFYNDVYIGGDSIRYVQELDNMAFDLAKQIEGSAVNTLNEIEEQEYYMQDYKDFLADFMTLDRKERENIMNYARSKRSVPA